ncbi:MAG: class I SAM-dependent methyltransferase [Myxococcales bacterium]
MTSKDDEDKNLWHMTDSELHHFRECLADRHACACFLKIAASLDGLTASVTSNHPRGSLILDEPNLVRRCHDEWRRLVARAIDGGRLEDLPQDARWPAAYLDSLQAFVRYRGNAWRLRQLKSWMRGQALLDYGCGNGEFAMQMWGAGLFDRVLGIDVEDTRHEMARAVLPFAKVDFAGAALAAEELQPLRRLAEGGTGTLLHVLHHLHDRIAGPRHVLENLGALGLERIVIVEDVPVGLDEYKRMTCGIDVCVEALASYLALAEEGQLHSLALCDFFFNVLLLGADTMPLPCGFRSIAGWKQVLRETGWKLTAAIPLCFPRGYALPSAYCALIADR